jgi:hypothetical protein
MSVLFKGPNRVGVSLTSPEDGNRSSFRNVFSSYSEFLTIDKVQKQWFRGWNKPCANLPFCEILRQHSANWFSSNIVFILHRSKSYFGGMGWNQFPNRLENGLVFGQLLAVHCNHLWDFHCRAKILFTIQKPMYEEKHCHIIRKVRGCCFAIPETKLNARTLQWSAPYKILNTTDRELQERSDGRVTFSFNVGWGETVLLVRRTLIWSIMPAPDPRMRSTRWRSMEWELAGETEVLEENLPSAILSTINRESPCTWKLKHVAACSHMRVMDPALEFSCQTLVHIYIYVNQTLPRVASLYAFLSFILIWLKWLWTLLFITWLD